MDLFKHSPVIIFAPHIDDGEIGCGGLINQFVNEGIDVYYVGFSSAKISLQPGQSEDILVHEVREATGILGIKQENLILFDFPTRHFPEYRQKILDEMIILREKIKPKLIFTPSLNDIHQDHATVAAEALRCFKKQSILCYEEPWNNISFSTNCFIQLTEENLQKKLQALRCYQSQKHRIYFNEDSIVSLAKMRGTQLEGGYAEAFEVIRWML